MDKITYLVLAAQEEELNGLFKPLDHQRILVEGKEVLKYEDKDVQVFGAIGGIGKVSMAYVLSLLLHSIHPDYVINTGVCGSVSPELRKMQILVADKACYHDVHVEAFGYHAGQMCQLPLYYECDRTLIEKAKAEKNDRVKVGLILSGDSFITKENIDPDWFAQYESPLGCDMESGAVGQVCFLAKVPFLVIRAVSDDPASGEDNKSIYEDNLEEASRLAGELVRKIIFSK